MTPTWRYSHGNSDEDRPIYPYIEGNRAEPNEPQGDEFEDGDMNPDTLDCHRVEPNQAIDTTPQLIRRRSMEQNNEAIALRDSLDDNAMTVSSALSSAQVPTNRSRVDAQHGGGGGGGNPVYQSVIVNGLVSSVSMNSSNPPWPDDEEEHREDQHKKKKNNRVGWLKSLRKWMRQALWRLIRWVLGNLCCCLMLILSVAVVLFSIVIAHGTLSVDTTNPRMWAPPPAPSSMGEPTKATIGVSSSSWPVFGLDFVKNLEMENNSSSASVAEQMASHVRVRQIWKRQDALRNASGRALSLTSTMMALLDLDDVESIYQEDSSEEKKKKTAFSDQELREMLLFGPGLAAAQENAINSRATGKWLDDITAATGAAFPPHHPRDGNEDHDDDDEVEKGKKTMGKRSNQKVDGGLYLFVQPFEHISRLGFHVALIDMFLQDWYRRLRLLRGDLENWVGEAAPFLLEVENTTPPVPTPRWLLRAETVAPQLVSWVLGIADHRGSGGDGGDGNGVWWSWLLPVGIRQHLDELGASLSYRRLLTNHLMPMGAAIQLSAGESTGAPLHSVQLMSSYAEQRARDNLIGRWSGICNKVANNNDMLIHWWGLQAQKFPDKFNASNKDDGDGPCAEGLVPRQGSGCRRKRLLSMMDDVLSAQWEYCTTLSPELYDAAIWQGVRADRIVYVDGVGLGQNPTFVDLVNGMTSVVNDAVAEGRKLQSEADEWLLKLLRVAEKGGWISGWQ